MEIEQRNMIGEALHPDGRVVIGMQRLANGNVLNVVKQFSNLPFSLYAR